VETGLSRSVRIPSSQWRLVNVIWVEFAEDFRGGDVVLLSMDGPGLDTFAAALGDAERRGSSRLEHDGVTHRFLVQAGAADVDLGDDEVLWRLDHAKAREILEHLTSMSDGDRPCHQYVDIYSPTDTLVLSRDEYLRQGPSF
jgi:hypothetical protein